MSASPLTRRETSDEVEQAAASWLARMDKLDADAPDHEALAGWLAQDTRHQGAYVRALAAWKALDQARAVDWEPTKATQQTDVPTEAPQSLVADHSARRVSRRGLLVAAAAALATCALGAAEWWKTHRGEVYETRRGEILRVALSEGSTLILNTATHIEVAVHLQELRIVLEAGEAWFHVSQHLKRPCRVSAGPLAIRAHDAEFTVRHEQKSIALLVVRGAVELAGGGRAGLSDMALSAGTTLRMSSDGPVSRALLGQDAIGRSLAWLNGELQLKGETVAQAAAEFNRYNATRLVVSDPWLAEQTVVGRFDINDTKNFAESVATLFGARVRFQGAVIELDRARGKN